jgi:hypothetical protein
MCSYFKLTHYQDLAKRLQGELEALPFVADAGPRSSHYSPAAPEEAGYIAANWALRSGAIYRLRQGGHLVSFRRSRIEKTAALLGFIDNRIRAVSCGFLYSDATRKEFSPGCVTSQ